MKKFLIWLTTIILLISITATFVGCGDKDYSDLKDRMDKIEEDYKALEERLEKLETTVSLLNTMGDASQFTELKNKVTALQNDLINNSASDTQIKSQVTQMQLALDKLSDSSDVNDTILNEVQNQLNTLYGEVNRVLQFENGKEYEVKLNGVVYYTISILLEYHDGIVQSEQDIKVCDATHGAFWQEHFCGSILVKNKRDRTITVSQMRTGVVYEFDKSYYGQISILDKEGTMDYNVTESILPGEDARWYFYIRNSSGNMPVNSFKLTFRMPELNAMTLLTLDNVWADENGLMPPIIGTK